VDKYSWEDIGSSYIMSDILAAFLYGQLERWAHIQAKRQRIWESYHKHLAGWAEEQHIRLPIIPRECEQSYHMYYLLLPSLRARQALIAFLKERDIQAVFHYLPLHISDMGRRFGGKEGDCPVTEDISDRLLRLPFYTTLDEPTQNCVIEAVQQFRP
jgi:dTDP-4-amino-4,6-dideoxygalactose transaminase